MNISLLKGRDFKLVTILDYNFSYRHASLLTLLGFGASANTFTVLDALEIIKQIPIGKTMKRQQEASMES